MLVIIEEKLMKCSRCRKMIKYYCNSFKLSGFMLFIYFILIIVIVGIWFFFVIVWKIINKFIGGWKCLICE